MAIKILLHHVLIKLDEAEDSDVVYKRAKELGIKVGNVYKTNLNSVSPAKLTVLEILTDTKDISGWDNTPNIIRARRESELYTSKDFTFEYSVDEIIKESELINV